jgi:tetratricopeptide (TPR) repeat protein
MCFARQGNKDLANKIYDTLIEQNEKDGTITSRYFNIKKKRDNVEKPVFSKIDMPAQGAAEIFYNMARILYQDQSDESALVFSRLSAELDPQKRRCQNVDRRHDDPRRPFG